MFIRMRRPAAMIFAVLVLIMLTCPGCSCRGEGTDDYKEEPKTVVDKDASDPQGSYEITGMIFKGKKTPDEDIELMKKKGLNCTLTLEDEGKGVVDLFGNRADITWNDDSITAGGKSYGYALEGDVLTLELNDSSLTFTRTK